MKDENGEYLAKADSLWTYISMDSGAPERIPEDILTGYKIEPRLDMDYQGRKIAFPKDIKEETCRRISISEHLLDANHHVNNGKYVAMGASFLPEDVKIKDIRVGYLSQAYLGDVITPRLVKAEDGYIVSLEDKDGKPYAVMEFK